MQNRREPVDPIQMAGWLCPTERDRARVLDMSDRIRRARAIAAGAIGIGVLFPAPWSGWWTLLLFAVTVVSIATLDRRMARPQRPPRPGATPLPTTFGVRPF